MRISVIKIGNSKGIRLPKKVLEKYQISDSVEMILEDEYIKLKPKTEARKGWEDSFARMHENGDDYISDNDILDDDNFE